MKKMNITYITIILIIVLITGCNSKEDNVDQNSGSISDNYETITLREIQQELIEYLKTEDLELELGTEEFFEFANSQIIENIDKKLAAMKNYSLIHSYLTEYVLEYANYDVCKQALAQGATTDEILKLCGQSKCVKYNVQSQKIEFIITDEFLNQTIAEIAEKNENQ